MSIQSQATKTKTWTLFSGHICTGFFGGTAEKTVYFNLDVLGDVEIVSADLQIYARPTVGCAEQHVDIRFGEEQAGSISWSWFDTGARRTGIDISRYIRSGENSFKILYSAAMPLLQTPCVELEIKLTIVYRGTGTVTIPIAGPRIITYLYYILLILLLIGGGAFATWAVLRLWRKEKG